MRSAWLAASIVVFMAPAAIVGQEYPNIVPNSGFERYSATPLGWFYTGDDFTKVVQYWESPTAASPDVYGPRVYIPTEWKEQGFGTSRPHEGRSMAGITCYGCEGGKPHCREYLQVQLSEPLVPGQRYFVAFWARPLEHSLRIMNLGVAFSKDRVHLGLDTLLVMSPVIQNDVNPQYASGEWSRVTGEFVASEALDYLLIGNFSNDQDTRLSGAEDSAPLTFAYYYIDDVDVHKLPPIVEVPIAEDDLRNIELVEGATVRLNNIYFDHDKDEFLPRSYTELDQLVGIMKENPGMKILIQGHTDNVGGEEYNLTLSLSRAEAVAKYLNEKGIASSRTTCLGFGSTKPIEPNDTDEGRKHNRRVEFVIVSK